MSLHRQIIGGVTFTLFSCIPGVLYIGMFYVIYMLVGVKAYGHTEKIFWILLFSILLSVASAPFLYFKVKSKHKASIYIAAFPLIPMVLTGLWLLGDYLVGGF